MDPHIPMKIVDMGLIDEVKVDKDNNVHVDFHGSNPYCPMAIEIGRMIKEAASAVPGVKKVTVKLNSHVNEDECNKAINE